MTPSRPTGQRGAAARRRAQARQRRVRRATLAVVLVVGSLGVAALLATRDTASDSRVRSRAELLADGEDVFAANCATCHGDDLRGTFVGPPLLHEIYLPDHHPDSAIRAAVHNGVSAHHWDSDGMPPIPALSDDDVDAVIAYIRAAQEAAGLTATSTRSEGSTSTATSELAPASDTTAP